MLAAHLRRHLAAVRAETKRNPDRGDIAEVGFGFAAIVVIVVIIWAIVYFANCFGSTDGGHVAVVRNGGPLDSQSIRQVLPANSGLTNIGEFSDMHDYPTSQRYFTFSAAGGGDSDESLQEPSADGIEMGFDGTAYFTVNTDSAKDYAVLKTFDNNYGTRTYRCSNGDRKSVWDGDQGFSCFLEQMIQPIINNNMREEVGSLRCADLIASCSLVQNGATGLDTSKVGQGNVNLAQIQANIAKGLQTDLDSTLHGNYIKVEGFNITGVHLPANIQKGVDDAQAAYAAVTKAQADQKAQVVQAQTQQKQQLIQSETELQQAKLQAAAKEELQRGYNSCPVCGQIDIVNALPQGITVYAPGNGSLTIPAK